MKKLVLTLILLASAFSLVPVNAQVQGIAVTGTSFGPSSSPIAVEPGSFNVPLFIYITNLAQYPALNVSVRAESTSVFSITGEPQNVSLIPPGETVPFIAYVNVSPRAVSGVYTLPLQISYVQGGYQKNFTYSAQLPVSTFSSLQVYTWYWGNGETLAYPGAKGLPLTIVVRNAGTNTAYNATVTLNLGYPFYFASGKSLHEFVGAIPPGASVPLTFYVNINSSAVTGYYPINLTLEWNSGIGTVQQVYVPVLGSPDVRLQGFGTNPPQIFPGTQDAELAIYVVNSGNVTASNVKINISTSGPIIFASQTATTIGLLPPGTPVQLTYLFSVNSNASSPSYANVSISISYGGRNSASVIRLPVSSKAQLKAVPESVTLTQGASDIKVTYNITNYGNYTAKDVQAELILPNMLSGNTYDYLGDIPPGSSVTAVFSLDVSSSAPVGEFRGTIVTSWLQDNAPGETFSQIIPVSFIIKESYVNQFLAYVSSPPAIYILLIAILLVIIAILAVVAARRR